MNNSLADFQRKIAEDKTQEAADRLAREAREDAKDALARQDRKEREALERQDAEKARQADMTKMALYLGTILMMTSGNCADKQLAALGSGAAAILSSVNVSGPK